MHQYSFFTFDYSKPEPAQSIDALTRSLADYLPPLQVNQIKRAYYYAEQAHEGQNRRSGEPYVTHPLAVAGILSNMRMDAQSLMAAMLHDVIEDTAINKPDLSDQFGEVVAELVDGVSKLTRIEFQSKAEQQAENFQKMALAMAKDIRVILVKLADRLHNMRTLGVLPPPKRRRIARETLEIYAPIAQRLGMHTLRVEFEDLGFQAMHPMRAARIRKAIKNRFGDRKKTIEAIRQNIENCLDEEGHTAQVVGREKHLYSIYNKMRNKRKSLREILDLYAFRIVVDSVDTCYRVLGCVHSLYKPVPGQFKDYIAIPKANGYQSLHTVLFGMEGVPIEIQIRTHEMEEMANNGIAAHWLYKSSEQEPRGNSSHARARQWVQGLLEMQQRAGDSLEFIENVKIDLFPDEVYVFTPRGDIMELPAGATAVDFAYAVHSDIGNSCVACRINRRLAPLSEPLQSGQTVEVITTPGAQPNPAWLNFVVTAKARSGIRHFLKHQRKTEAVELGKRMLERALASMETSLDEFEPHHLDQLVEVLHTKSIESLLEQIGMGNRVAYLTARQLLNLRDERHQDDENALPAAQSRQAMVIHGTEGFLVNFARCCYPIPGDHIVGIVSSEKGVVVHCESCHNSIELRNEPERVVPLTWADDIDRDFSVELKVELSKQRGIIAVLATRVNGADASIEKISVEDENPKISTIHLVIGVRSRVHLASIMRRIRNIPAVIKVEREKH
ncbi:bifunctional GTP diphosphokinase/guanosine-3',5'-bis pyrophosphate 3'-pyrophosphohydrolase [Spongiibacter nanhainus]|uniref:guanosine-3',5'-bis(diphosphate) 3'-diphosphatase n=1 Tax=Spongiibacter nanhainus TaxID=2794344 RepID=A0A7T4R0K5_9GAMM|nr:bifunctional GTP diphosphokinase/guanosine-3',5'-bis pyrophosphate 3'-pyrophosphohydrolase [Spongiibacter nanhainus]QQD18208.1 bifunctional GTP diphosphokinase/guanosine-3',5'-bis pyrophosphate 3'-pyrophosphohydrolase [Spongiibacter nanhainus]